MTTEPTTAARLEFLREQVDALEPLGYVDVAPDWEPAPEHAPGAGTAVPPPPLFVRVERLDDGAGRRVVVQPITDDGDAPALPDSVAKTLDGLGFTGDPPATAATADTGQLLRTVDGVLTQVLGAPAGTRLDVRHDSRRWVREAEQKLATIRSRIEGVLTGLVGAEGFELDPEGDFTFPLESTRVFVGARILLGGPAVVLVFAPTNIDIDPTPALAMFLARTNAELAFGRFAIDVAHRTVWFGHNLFGDSFTDDELHFIVGVVARTADSLDDQIEKVFGGRLVNPPGRAAPVEESPASKPAPTGGYL